MLIDYLFPEVYAKYMDDNLLGLIAGLLPAIISIPIIIISIMSLWRIFTKAERAGWYSIIPIYNMVVLLQISGKPGWWILLYFVPIVNLIFPLVASLGLAKAFGKSEVFGVIALWLFSGIGYLILGFGSAKYVGTTVAKPTETPPATPQAAS